MEQLTDDVVLEILVRVTGILDLFRCAATCARWRLLIADDSFLRRRWPEGTRHRSSLLGFIPWQQPRSEEGTATWIIPAPMLPFTAPPWSPFGHRSLIPNIPEPPGHGALLLTSRRGLLLVCFIPHDNSPRLETPVLKLAVCDPFAGKTHALPPLKADGRLFRLQEFTILTRADCCSKKPAVPSVCRAAFFKVLIVTCAEQGYNLHAFTSGDSGWSTPIKFFDHLEDGEIIESLRANAAVCQGTANWLFKDRSSYYTLNVSTDDTTRIFLTKLPIAPEQPGFDFYSVPVLGVTNQGTLSVLRLYRKCTGVEIWTRQGGNKNGDATCWHLSKTIRLQRPEKSKIDMVQCVCVGEMSGTLLIKDNKNCMYIADLEAGTMENITESFRGGVVAGAIPFEMDWPAFFMSRMAGGAIKRTKLEGAAPKVDNSFWGQIFGQLSWG